MNLQFVEHQIVHMLLFHVKGHLINAPRVHGLDDMTRFHIAEKGDFLTEFRREFLLCPANDDVRMHALGLQFLDGMLRGLGLEFLGGLQIRNEGEVNAQEVFFRQLPLQLPHGFHEGLAFHIAHRAANFGDNDVIVPRQPQQEHPALDFVRNMGDNLDGLAQIGALPLLGNDGVVDSAGGDVIGLRGINAQKTFIVAQIKVRFRAVLRHITFPVLIGIERPGIDV